MVALKPSDGMYYLAPVIKVPANLQLPATSGPNTMYQLPPLVSLDGPHVTDDCESKHNLVELSGRQEAAIQKLLELQQRLNQLRLGQEDKNNTASDSTSSTAPRSNTITGIPTLQEGVCHDVVLSTPPTSPPFSIIPLAAVLRSHGISVITSSNVHSSLKQGSIVPAMEKLFCSCSVKAGGRASHQMALTVIWADVPTVTLMVNPLEQCAITGESNVIRYLCRLLPASSPLHYEADSSFATVAATDIILDSCATVLDNPHDKQQRKTTAQFINKVNVTIGNSTSGSFFGAVGDVAMWSTLKQLAHKGTHLPPAVAAWVGKMDAGYLTGVVSTNTRGAVCPATTNIKTFYNNSNYRLQNCISGKDVNNIDKLDCYKNNGGNISNVSCKTSTNKATTPGKCSNVPPAAASSAGPPAGKLCRADLESTLQQLGICYHSREHSAVMTVDQLLAQVTGMPGLHMKNLFLRDKKAPHQLYLVAARHDAKVPLNSVAKSVGCKELRFASSDLLLDVLGVYPGHVTLYALINDATTTTTTTTTTTPSHDAPQPNNNKRPLVKVIIDDRVMEDPQQFVNFHPMVNTATLAIKCCDVAPLLRYTGHEPTYMTFDTA